MSLWLSLAPPAHADEPLPEAVLAELPFLESEQRNRVYLDLAPADYATRMHILLDTGAAFSIFTPRAARAVGVRARRLKSDPYRRKTLLGRDLQFRIDTSSSDTAGGAGGEYGLLGGNFLAEYVLELDFPERRVRFLDPRRYEVPTSAGAPGETVMPLTIVANRPGTTVAFNGEATTVLIDTGAPCTALLSGDLAERAGVASAPAPGFRMSGVFGAAESALGEAETLAFGAFEFGRVPVAVAPRGWHNQGFPGDSVIGYDLLAPFVVRIDYRRGRIWLRRASRAPLAFCGLEYAEGAALRETDEGRRVAFVVPGTPAAQRGVSAGDLLESE